MPQKIHNFYLELTMKLMNDISKVDRFDASWSQIEKREGQTLKQLKAIATVRSVGASTRIEGSKMTDAEVEVLIDQLKVSKLEERDEQEVAGYFEALDTITTSFKDIDITEGDLKNLHKILMSHAEKDSWHRGDYKQQSNAVEANHPDGTKQVLFRTTDPGLATQQAMKELLQWYHADDDTLPIVKSAIFIYDFLSIHPFQDGNGRLSRLLATLLLLKHGYSWIQYVSFEHEIENRKAEYYDVLMKTQKKRPGEKIDAWIIFFLDCLLNIQDLLMNKLNSNANAAIQLDARKKNILTFIEHHPGTKSGEIAKKLSIPLSTVKKMLTTLYESKLILKYGVGAGTNYLVEKQSPLKEGLMFQLTNANRKIEFVLQSPASFIEIKEIVITPLFSWQTPNEWALRISHDTIGFKITGTSARGGTFSHPFYLSPLISLYHFKPKLILNKPINIPFTVRNGGINLNEFPIKIEIELLSSVDIIDFDLIFIYDEV